MKKIDTHPPLTVVKHQKYFAIFMKKSDTHPKIAYFEGFWDENDILKDWIYKPSSQDIFILPVPSNHTSHSVIEVLSSGY
jgi:hypothetical protein